VFFITSLSLTYIYSHPAQQQGVMDRVDPAAVQLAPAAPAAGQADGSKSGEIPK
jgi:preprotein translocase subunit SecG